MNAHNQWYVTIEGNAVGPVSTDLVVRGIKHKKIANNAYVCVVGATEWQLLADVQEFNAAMREGGLLESVRLAGAPEESEMTGSAPGQRAPASEAAIPAECSATETESSTDTTIAANTVGELSPMANAPTEFAGGIGESQTESHRVTDRETSDTNVSLTQNAPRNGKHAETAHEARATLASMDVDIDIHVDDSPAASVDWNRGFSAYFLVASDVPLPDEHALLHSLDSEPHDTFLHDEAMWNLALCLAFGTEAVARAAASVFFDVVAAHGLYGRIEWICRTLLSRGFMPSGIPHAAGYRGLAFLQSVCPPGLLPKLEAEAAS